MIGYALVGSKNLDQAKAFYDELLKPLGAAPLFEHPSGGRVYGKTAPAFGVVGPHNGAAATVGNGTMISFLADTQEQVHQVFAKAIELGGGDEGGPGWRGDPGGFYGAYFRDLDGNKLCVYRIGPED
ncbi:VOC family protein [Novosphingobium sp. G106]|uniref:VOC family protein n=1 Tax=Novosphingobium sp. G106 TaxID=2849500 RepID=UPI001C2D8A00|nr:VOC family protein [Novosphingobium sp. G106]MBV1688322.1 VOC family protein [Novosphingobium sp. G106]